MLLDCAKHEDRGLVVPRVPHRCTAPRAQLPAAARAGHAADQHALIALIPYAHVRLHDLVAMVLGVAENGVQVPELQDVLVCRRREHQEELRGILRQRAQIDLHRLPALLIGVVHGPALVPHGSARGVAGADAPHPDPAVVQHAIAHDPHAVRAAVVDYLAQRLALEDEARGVEVVLAVGELVEPPGRRLAAIQQHLAGSAHQDRVRARGGAGRLVGARVRRRASASAGAEGRHVGGGVGHRARPVREALRGEQVLAALAEPAGSGGLAIMRAPHGVHLLAVVCGHDDSHAQRVHAIHGHRVMVGGRRVRPAQLKGDLVQPPHLGCADLDVFVGEALAGRVAQVGTNGLDEAPLGDVLDDVRPLPCVPAEELDAVAQLQETSHGVAHDLDLCGLHGVAQAEVLGHAFQHGDRLLPQAHVAWVAEVQQLRQDRPVVPGRALCLRAEGVHAPLAIAQTVDVRHDHRFRVAWMRYVMRDQRLLSLHVVQRDLQVGELGEVPGVARREHKENVRHALRHKVEAQLHRLLPPAVLAVDVVAVVPHGALDGLAASRLRLRARPELLGHAVFGAMHAAVVHDLHDLILVEEDAARIQGVHGALGIVPRQLHCHCAQDARAHIVHVVSDAT
mmetsp:Transcript_52489/g.135472  ORF Transcript_52489/g.135472 Transcript_52489/m.135472 type:complete len:623 (-) Transcript_52489:1265-3133(-)